MYFIGGVKTSQMYICRQFLANQTVGLADLERIGCIVVAVAFAPW